LFFDYDNLEITRDLRKLPL